MEAPWPAASLMRFAFPRSHAFPGGRVVVEDDAAPGPDCLVEFGDGVIVMAAWRPAGGGIDLSVPAYRTARGTEVTARNWHLARRRDGAWRSERAAGSPQPV